MIKIINSSNETLAILQNVVSPIVTEQINGEFSASFQTVIDNDKSNYVNYQNKAEIDGNYFNIVYTEDTRTDAGCFISAQCEHVSYDFLRVTYTAGFTATGPFSAVATTLLNDVNTALSASFTLGTVEITASQTISVNQSSTARTILMDLAALYGGELKFDKYAISLLTRRGADRGVQFRYRKNLTGVSRITDARTLVAGVPTVSYKCSAAELEYEQGYIEKGYSSLEHYELGDTVKTIDEDLNISVSARILKYAYDPDQRKQGNVEIGNFINDITNTLTQIKTTTVVKDSVYNGCSIGPDNGFVAERSDLLAKVSMNATQGIIVQLRPSTTASYTNVFYVQVDTASGTANLYLAGDAIFNGELAIGSGNNIVKAEGSTGLWVGNASYASAPFKVSLSGSVTASDITMTGSSTISGGQIFGATYYGSSSSTAYMKVGGSGNLADWRLFRGSDSVAAFLIYDNLATMGFLASSAGSTALASFMASNGNNTYGLNTWDFTSGTLIASSVNGSFSTSASHTVTVTNGIITSIV